jgi:hypothetical protein
MIVQSVMNAKSLVALNARVMRGTVREIESSGIEPHLSADTRTNLNIIRAGIKFLDDVNNAIGAK